MDINYKKIGQRIAARRRQLGLKQAQLSEMADISTTYVSSIGRAVSIPSIEVIMRPAMALDGTPNEFLVCFTFQATEIHWKMVSQFLCSMDDKRLEMAKSFLV